MEICDLSINDNIIWTIEVDGLYILDQEKKLGFMLYYPEAALWDIFSRIKTKEQLILQMASIINCDRSQADNYVDNTLSGWCRKGILVKK